MRFAVLCLASLFVSCGARTGLETTRADGGLDGGARDAGARDAGTDGGRADAGLDAALPRCPFDVDATVVGTLRLSADDRARVFLHGELLDDRERIWSEIATYEVPLFRHPSRANVIAVEATNVFRIDGRDRGVLADLRAVTEIGSVALVTDGAWALSIRFEPGFFELDHDARAWLTPTLEGRHPIAPWGPIFGTSDAEWLWSYDSNRPESSKPEREQVWLRRIFFFDVDGHVVDAPGACP